MAVVKAADGRRWVTTIDDAAAELDTPPRPQPSAQSFTTKPLTPVDHYLARGHRGARRGARRPLDQSRDRPRDTCQQR